MFCHLQSQPTLYEDQSYSMLVQNNKHHAMHDRVGNSNKDEDTATVTPMTITYNYELYDGQLLFTDAESELIPNLDFDYAIVGMNGIRNINRDTGKLVSLDEVYFHHFTFFPLNMVRRNLAVVIISTRWFYILPYISSHFFIFQLCY